MTDYSKYLEVCKKAVEDDNIFRNFKRHPDYIPILEHVNYQQGLEYITEIERIAPSYILIIDEFADNDKIGNPITYYFDEIGIKISPTTLRYIKVFADIVSLFGNLDNMDIVEIGGGYGGQCKIINIIYNPKSYTIIDASEALMLCGKYLKNYNNLILRNTSDPSEIHYDLCISNYAFTEIERKYQSFYADRVIKNSDRGYVTCNFITNDNFNKDEIFALKTNYTIYQERPLTGNGNLIYIWQ